MGIGVVVLWLVFMGRTGWRAFEEEVGDCVTYIVVIISSLGSVCERANNKSQRKDEV